MERNVVVVQVVSQTIYTATFTSSSSDGVTDHDQTVCLHGRGRQRSIAATGIQEIGFDVSPRCIERRVLRLLSGGNSSERR